MNSYLSPYTIFLVYYFNFCITHNLYHTLHSHSLQIEKRMKYYKIFGILGSLIVLIISILVSHVLSQHNFVNLLHFENTFVICYYLIGFIVIIYISYKLLLIIWFHKKRKFYGVSKIIEDEIKENLLQNKIIIVENYVKQNIFLLLLFLICYTPNNIIILTNLMNIGGVKISSNENNWVFLFQIFLSSSCFLTIIVKISEIYMIKLLKKFYYFLEKKLVKKDFPHTEVIESTTFNRNSFTKSFSIAMNDLGNPYGCLDNSLRNLDLFCKCLSICTSILKSNNSNEYHINENKICSELKDKSKSK